MDKILIPVLIVAGIGLLAGIILAVASAIMAVPKEDVYKRQCVPCVKKGDHVYVGTKVADSDAYVSVPIHSSVSGTVKEIKKVIMPGGQAVDAVIITSDGLMEHDPAVCPPPEIKTKQQLSLIHILLHPAFGVRYGAHFVRATHAVKLTNQCACPYSVRKLWKYRFFLLPMYKSSAKIE